MRDRNLDIYRGAIMIYITCFCHLIWWEGVKVGIFEGSWITGIFFAMATVFYIVGASFSLSLEKPFRTYLKGRIKRVAIPYWKYALVCFPAVVYHYLKSGAIIPLNDFISYVFWGWTQLLPTICICKWCILFPAFYSYCALMSMC